MLCGRFREGSFDKSLPVHVATQGLNSQRMLFEECKQPAWKKHLVITFIRQLGAWAENTDRDSSVQKLHYQTPLATF